MHAPVTYTGFDGPRSLLEERPMRPPIIGKIRPGIKVLTRKARENAEAVRIHDTLLAQGHSFEKIQVEIERKTNLRNALVPKNVPWFTCRASDFTNPAIANEILQRYGEDRGDGNGLKLWRFPVKFAFDDWLQNMPHQLVAWTTTGRQFFSDYGSDGKRYCKAYAPVPKNERANRARRMWGGRTIILRQDDDIPDGLCDPQVCPQYQLGACNLSASFYFAVPFAPGLGLVELPTTSIYVLQKAHAAMQTVLMARGKLVGVEFWISKQEIEISRIEAESGKPVRQMQWLITLDADIDIGALLDGTDRRPPALELATHAVSALEAGAEVGEPVVEASSETHAAASASPGAVEPGGDDGTDFESQFRDLVARLGLNSDDGMGQLKVYAAATFGRGWSKREQDIRQLLSELRTALAHPLAFREQVAAIAAEISP
ncbi:recombination directionality factor [Cupriavidus numazuensis]|uniref:Uncharacterized protein n=1 Tax=Cupriavidus numazuensis TaxID=221992 RepID=A0ABM8TTI1_9BURK|nr:hypothetical protein [Cupriavidus numazuensis]CAG2159765.1 hypothetical protein LMG26411_06961 [Cupriavidus numazuensis]